MNSHWITCVWKFPHLIPLHTLWIYGSPNTDDEDDENEDEAGGEEGNAASTAPSAGTSQTAASASQVSKCFIYITLMNYIPVKNGQLTHTKPLRHIGHSLGLLFSYLQLWIEILARIGYWIEMVGQNQWSWMGDVKPLRDRSLSAAYPSSHLFHQNPCLPNWWGFLSISAPLYTVNTSVYSILFAHVFF